MLLVHWYLDGMHLDDRNAAPEILILGIVLLAVWAMLTGMFIYYVHKFNQAASDRKLTGRTMIWVSAVLGIIQVLCAVLDLIFWGVAGKMVVDDTDPKLQSIGSACIALIVISFVILVALIIMMWFFLPQYGIAFTDDRILFMGEDIKYENITKIVIDEKTRATYVNYSKGRRNHGRIKFKAGSQFGSFIQENSSLTGHKAEVADENKYYTSLVEGTNK